MADVDRAKWNMSRTVWLNGFVDLSRLAFGLSLLICELFRATHIRQVCDSSPNLRVARQIVFEWVATRRRTCRNFPARPTQICTILSAARICTLFRFDPNASGDGARKSAVRRSHTEIRAKIIYEPDRHFQNAPSPEPGSCVSDGLGTRSRIGSMLRPTAVRVRTAH